ncbi:MAG TPA: LEA type 2 family protein [Bacteroidales bacterium]|nr:LEA type 2 family protein [Bacteroidales bacterium]
MNRKYIKNILATLLIIILLGSCSVYKSIHIGDVDKVDFRGMLENKISLELKVPVINPNKYKIIVKNMDLDVTINGKYIGKMQNASQIIIPPKSDTIQIFPVDIHVRNIMASMSTLYKLRNAKSVEMQIEGTIKVKALMRSKKIKVSEKQTISL